MHGFTITDLDADPQLTDEVLRLFQACKPGHNHAVCGEPSRMGCPVLASDLDDTLGVLCVHHNNRTLGALALCGYSDEQVTIWGPVVNRAFTRHGIGSFLLQEAKQAIRDGGYESLRTNIDTRNRGARSFFLGKGLSHWMKNCVYERNLLQALPANTGGVSIAKPADHNDVQDILAECFPDSSHWQDPLIEREREGYRHHILQVSGKIVGAGAVKVTTGRSWLSLFGMRSEYRRQGYGQQLLAGILANEHSHGAIRIGLEVLENNKTAIGIYESLGFKRSWTAHIMTGPVKFAH